MVWWSRGLVVPWSGGPVVWWSCSSLPFSSRPCSSRSRRRLPFSSRPCSRSEGSHGLVHCLVDPAVFQLVEYPAFLQIRDHPSGSPSDRNRDLSSLQVVDDFSEDRGSRVVDVAHRSGVEHDRLRGVGPGDRSRHKCPELAGVGEVERSGEDRDKNSGNPLGGLDAAYRVPSSLSRGPGRARRDAVRAAPRPVERGEHDRNCDPLLDSDECDDEACDGRKPDLPPRIPALLPSGRRRERAEKL